MALRFILGSSGSGKSYAMYEEVIRLSRENKELNYLMIVPEQFNMQTQKEFVEHHPQKGFMNIDILGFTRLAFKVFEEIDGIDLNVLEETGKSMAVRKVIELKKNELGIFSGSIKKEGFVGEIKNFLKEMYQYDINEEKMEKLLELTHKNTVLNNKFKDMLTIYKGFKEFLENRLVTQEEVLNILSENISKSEFIKNSVIFIDGFMDFTQVQYRLIEKLMKYSIDINIAFTIDLREKHNFTAEQIKDKKIKIDEYRLFSSIQKSMVKLIEIAGQNAIERKEDLLLKDTHRFKNNPAMKSLEENIFRMSYKKYRQQQESISVHNTLNPNEEVEFIAREIIELVRDKNYRYKDIAVVTGDMEQYCGIIDKVFLKNDIPCFTDIKRSILGNPFVELIRSALEVIIKDFSYEAVFRYLKCGLSDIAEEDRDILENYILASGIRGKKSWEKKWVKRRSKSFADFNYEKLNEVREKFINQIIPLREVFKDKKSTVKQKTIALWEFIQSMDIQNQLDVYKEKFIEKEEFTLVKQYEQIYKVIIELLDKFVDVLGEEVISENEYLAILEAGFEEIKLGIIPPSIDQIIVGDIERTRLKNIKVLFFIGVNDGIIPKANNGGGVISDIEKQIIADGETELDGKTVKNKKFLADNNIELPLTARQRAYVEKFYLYLNLTKPQDRLYITFSSIGLDGKSRRPSYLINNIVKLFDNIQINDEINSDNDKFITNPKTTLSHISSYIGDYNKLMENETWQGVLKWYLTNENWRDSFKKLVEAVFYKNTEKGISKAVAQALYTTELNNSVTRLEQYAQCAYAHFLSYGLELREREIYKFMSYDLGNIFHTVLELFSKKLKENNKEWKKISDKERNEIIEECVKEATEEYGNKILNSSARNEYIIQRIERIAKRTVWALQEQLKKGDFEPSSYEVSFSTVEDLESVNITLSENEKMKLSGRIDRVDKCEEDKKVYLKIIDYKSGLTSFDMLAVYYGIQLQLVVYMNAAIELERRNIKNKGKEIAPAGIFYYNIDDPIIEADEESTQEEINEEILKKLKLSGLVNDNLDVIRLLDREFNGRSKVLPISITKDNKKSDSLISEKQFKIISEYVNDKITQFGKEILAGNISINPYKLKDKSACMYCRYKAICGFDTHIEGNKYRKFKKHDNIEIWDKMEKETEENDETEE